VSNEPRILALFGGAIVFGQERGNMEALCALQDQGCEVLCLIRDEAFSKQVPSALDSVGLKWKRVAYIEQRMPGRLLWFLFRNPYAFVRANWQFLRITREFCPTHIHAFNALYVLNFLPTLALCDALLIYRAGDKPQRHNWFWKLIWSFILRRTHRFVANSCYIAEELLKSGASKEKICLIYSAPARRRQVTKFQAPKRLACNEVFFAYIGQISSEKGIDILIDAFRRVAVCYPNARLLVAGRISDWSGDSWARAVRTQALADTICRDQMSFLGYVDDIMGLLEFCDVHVCPSVWDEPLANVVMEAKVAGRPSIIFRSGGLPEVVIHGTDGYHCAEKNVESLASALRAYLDDTDMIKRHGIAAHASLSQLGVYKFPQAWRAVFGDSL